MQPWPHNLNAHELRDFIIFVREGQSENVYTAVSYSSANIKLGATKHMKMELYDWQGYAAPTD